MKLSNNQAHPVKASLTAQLSMNFWSNDSYTSSFERLNSGVKSDALADFGDLILVAEADTEKKAAVFTKDVATDVEKGPVQTR